MKFKSRQISCEFKRHERSAFENARARAYEDSKIRRSFRFVTRNYARALQSGGRFRSHVQRSSIREGPTANSDRNAVDIAIRETTTREGGRDRPLDIPIITRASNVNPWHARASSTAHARKRSGFLLINNIR